MKVEITDTANIEAVQVEEIKKFLKVTGSAHDEVLRSLNESARKYLENRTNLSFITKTIKVTADRELEDWELPYGPVNSITSKEEPNDDDEYVYTYEAGYEQLPQDLKQALKMTVKYWYDMEDITDELPKATEMAIKANQTNPML